MYLTEEDEIKFKNYEELSYLDTGLTTVDLYVNDECVGFLDVWRDRVEKNREYLIINYEIVYLDTIKKIKQ